MPTIPIPGRKPDVPQSFSLGDLLEGFNNDEVRYFIQNSEHSKDYLYRDTKGWPTIGTGHMIPTIDHALQIPFEYGYTWDTKRPATEDEIRRGYEQLPKQSPNGNYTAEYYKPENSRSSPLRISQNTIDRLLDDDIRAHAKSVSQKFSNFDNLPRPARLALLDMHFNMGNRLNSNKWGNLFQAVHQGDWETAAYESHRKDVGAKRNNEIYRLFIDALKQKR